MIGEIHPELVRDFIDSGNRFVNLLACFFFRAEWSLHCP